MSLSLRILWHEVLLAVLLFVSAGRLDLPWFWALIAVHFTVIMFAFRSMDPGLVRERIRPAPGGMDRALRWKVMPFYLAHLAVAGLDAGRFGWSPVFPWFVHTAGLVLVMASLGLAMWAMSTNRFFSPVVRIQVERGHSLITGGPYRYIRHPGYVGALLAPIGTALMLGSLWSLVPALPLVLLIVRRAVLEDRYLRQHLDGYTDYALRVRYRLMPGVW